MEDKYRPIGLMDSGLGGLSVLKEALKLLPNEDFIYYGDTKNAPYGTKDMKEVKELTKRVVNLLIDKGVKAVVIACNTATSVAVDEIRKEYSIPIIGIEPALKPAVKINRKGCIIIMATTLTLAEKKFKNLMEKYSEKSKIVSLPCPGLVEFVESGNIDGVEVRDYLNEKLEPFKTEGIGSIVLGCTHYPFVRNAIKDIVGEEVPIIDGSIGTSKQLKRQLQSKGMLNDKKEKGELKIFNSLEDSKVIDLSYRLINEKI
ncbi:glutamate racemase [Haloimpatiens sp. FM7315]|uniref:glutamate racemase n=1 Tax=Haloimpatiens sp. FM7315 TaxID=3298609 RepID=UPI0035A280DB